jgi:hypothetical protein
VSEFLPFCLVHDTLVHFFVPHGDMVGTSQKYRLSFVTNSCTVCNLSWLSVVADRIMESLSPNCLIPHHHFLRISRVTHPPPILLVCYWPSSRLLVSHHRICRPPRSLAPARNVKCLRSPDLQHVVGTSPLFVHPSTCYHTLAIFCISPAWCKPSPPLFSSALMLIPLLQFFSICTPPTFSAAQIAH